MRIVGFLERGEPIPAEHNPHMHKGQLQGVMECHIGSDFLLLWLDEETNIVNCFVSLYSTSALAFKN